MRVMGGGGVVAVNHSPVQECTLRSPGFHLYESSVFLEEKKSTFSITSHIQILMHLMKIFEVTGKRKERKWKLV